MSAKAKVEKKFSFDSLFKAGVVVDLDVSLWRARTSIKPLDLGIDDTDEVHKALALGQHRLVSKDAMERLRELAAKAKRRIESYSMSFPFVYGVRYTPNRVVDEMFEGLIQIRDEFDREADVFCFEEYAKAKSEQLLIILKALQAASKNKEVVDYAYERILAEYPNPEDVRKKFGIKWRIFAISGTSNPAAATGAQEETDSVKDAVRQMITDLRGELTDKIGAVMAIVAKGGKIPEPSVASAVEVLDRIEAMNVFGDSILESQTKALRQVITRAQESDSKRDRMNLVPDLSAMIKTMDASVEEAVAEAEKNLTGLGRRKIG